MGAHDKLRLLRSLVVDRRVPRSAPPLRVGRVILKSRPVLAVRGGVLEPAIGDLPSPDLHGMLEHREALEEIANSFAAGVARIDVRNGDRGWTPVGTGFLTALSASGGKPRLVTAGHMCSYLLSPEGFGVAPRRLFDAPKVTRANGALAECRAVFEDTPVEASSATDITSIIWPHGRSDLAICELDDDPGFDPLPIERTVDWANAADEPMAVLGYPIDESTLPQGDHHAALAAMFDNLLETRCLCPGFFTNATEPVGALPDLQSSEDSRIGHDATTLGGNSGSPIFSLRTKTVVGVHYAGGELVEEGASASDEMIAAAANSGVHLPFVLQEERLRIEMIDIDAPQPRPKPAAARPDSWTRRPIGSSADLEGATLARRGTDLPASLLEAVVPDRPDDRDYYYTPRLIAVPDELPPPKGISILNQGGEPACVGFTLAAAINLQCRMKRSDAPLVSPRMLQEMAKAHDEWVDESSLGTSLRGGLKGFHYSGACRHEIAPYFDGLSRWHLTRRAAEDAPNVTLGGYYRVEPTLNAFQNALTETGCILVSARIHSGWVRPARRRIGRIPFSANRKPSGNHAFLIVGFDKDGFVIQNSWGSDWSAWEDQAGLAHWSYADWAENVLDAWVMRLAASTPAGFDVIPLVAQIEDDRLPGRIARLPRPRRYSLLGHIVHAERDGIVGNGRLGLGTAPLVEAAAELSGSEEYPHIALIYHEPLLGSEATIRIAGHMTPGLMDNGIYPLHIVYGCDELETIRVRLAHEAQLVARRFASDLSGTSRYLARRARALIGPVLESFRTGAEQAARPGEALWRAASSFCIDAVRARRLHLVSIGCGAIAADAQCVETQKNAAPKISSLVRIGALPPPDALSSGSNVPRTTEVVLSKAAKQASLPPFEGDWADLVHAASRDASAGGPRRLCSSDNDLIRADVASLDEALLSPSVLNKFVELISGRRPPPTRRFRPI